MKTTARLAVLTTALTLVSGCTGGHLRHKDRVPHEPVQLPSAPTIERNGAAAGAAAPAPAPFSPFPSANMPDASPSPLSSTQPKTP
ncbi:hypothetical protein [Aquisphaera insulae]|uniref:hypothetical protein n=1 Tax=Aquisphaera insulae TaxID=2712864 RepID=UPI0013ED4F09|nr:hypothetical protein [Aquisphaera insulae]